MPKCLQKEIASGARGALLRRLASETRGNELVEFAMVLWIFLGLLILIFWCGRAYNIHEALERAAREGARVYLASTCATCGNSTTDPTAAINRVLTAATLDPAQASPTFVQNNSLVTANPPSYGQVSGVIVTVSYPLQFNLPLLGWINGTPGTVPSFTITSTVSMRQEY